MSSSDSSSALSNNGSGAAGASGGSDNMFTTAYEYIAGAMPDMETLTEVVKEAAETTGVTSTQAEPVSIWDDIAMSYSYDSKSSCVKYMFLGECWYIKTSWIPNIGTQSVAQNRLADLQIEVTSRVPSVSDSAFLMESDNAPTDSYSGSIVQNMGSVVGALFNELLTLDGDPGLQFMENESDNKNNDIVLFREALVIGNPVQSLIMNPFSIMPGYCSSSVSPYTPYFVSSLDLFSWRILATTDTILLPIYMITYQGWNEVGKNMGSVFPRIGYNESPDEFDVAVTTSYRALSIVSDLRPQFSGILGLHIASPTPAYASGSWDNRGDYKYRTVRDHVTQLLRIYYPFNGGTCTNFRGYSQSGKDQLNIKYNKKNKYHSGAFKVYRPYVCCKRKYQYLFTTAARPSFKTY
ncbi:hypothetical protein HUO09_16935 [Vibrio sp. Y2-5]|uniref:hypothetical protein n=1 Tax=Vibrio sp. Y2-5 TaxID=2743977 RepID=UPI0016604AC1|nr:hypothetical protein [Vibrio sp. Y2-5]MBD0788041.1 hypothetical protein [Vibrio sp. Y2-5]